MLLSIVIPVYNRGELVRRTLTSVLQQDYRPIQLILVDNNSTDNTLDTLNSFKNDNETNDFIIDVTTEKRQGAAIARNTGASLVKGDWMLFFDSDDVMLPSLVSSYVNVINNSPADTNLIYTGARTIQLNGSTITCPFRTNDLIINHLLHSIFGTVRYAIKHDAYLSVGGWNETLHGWDDWELGTRIALGFANNAVPLDVTPLIHIYSQEVSITGISFSDKHSDLEHALDVVEQDIRNSDNPDKQRLLLYVEYRRIVLSAHYKREGNAELAQSLYNSTYNRCKHILRLRMAFPYIFWHVSKGIPGSSRIIKAIL